MERERLGALPSTLITSDVLFFMFLRSSSMITHTLLSRLIVHQPIQEKNTETRHNVSIYIQPIANTAHDSFNENL